MIGGKMHTLVSRRGNHVLRRKIDIPRDRPAAVVDLGVERNGFRIFKLRIDGTVRASQ